MRLGFMSEGLVDLTKGPNGYIIEDGIETAVIVSLLTDRRAQPDDALPAGTSSQALLPDDRKGWCGDALEEVTDHRIGSRLWLLIREKQTEETRLRAIDYSREALHWLVADRHATDINIDASWSTMGRLNLSIVIILTKGGRFSLGIEDVTGKPYAV